MATSSRSKLPAALKPIDAADRRAIGERLLRCRIRLALQQPFLASALMRLPVREAYEMSWCKTAATDGYHLFYNPAWLTGLKDSEIRGVLAHEILHVLFAHSDRRSERDPLLWNYACDFAINGLLKQQGFKLPAGGLLSARFDGKTSEQIFDELKDMSADSKFLKKLQQKESSSGTDQGDLVPDIGDDILDADDPRIAPLKSPDAPDAQQLGELRRELREDALDKLKGTSSSSFRSECTADEQRQIDWRSLLRSWLSDRIKGDWTSYPFSKKHIHRGLFMPSPSMVVPAHVVFAVDTSGSMDDALIAKIYGEIQAFREVFPCRLSVLQVDTQVQSVQDFEAMDGLDSPSTFTVLGRGGTDFRPAFEWVEESAPNAVVLYATDGLGTYPSVRPASPVIWLLTNRNYDEKRVPFGSVIRACET